MSKLTKLVASFIIFLLIFNASSISYSKSYDGSNDYKLTIQKDSFFISSESKIDLDLEPNLVIQKDINKIMLNSFISTYLTYLFSSVALLFLVLLVSPVKNDSLNSFLVSDFFIYFSIIIINSLSILVFRNKEKPYYLTLVGSLLGFISYFIFIFGELFIESLIIDSSKNTFVTKNQIILLFAFMPVFITSVGTTFYHLITKEKPEEMTEEKLSKILEEQSKSIKELSNKIRISGSSVSFSLVKF